jgi:hypothetical protein
MSQSFGNFSFKKKTEKESTKNQKLKIKRQERNFSYITL